MKLPLACGCKSPHVTVFILGVEKTKKCRVYIASLEEMDRAESLMVPTLLAIYDDFMMALNKNAIQFDYYILYKIV